MLTVQGHPEFDTALMLTIIDLLDGQGLFKKMGYFESLEEIVANIKLNYSDSAGGEHGFSALLDNILLGKCIVSLMLPPCDEQ